MDPYLPHIHITCYMEVTPPPGVQTVLSVSKVSFISTVLLRPVREGGGGGGAEI